MRKGDQILALCLLIFCAVVYFAIIPTVPLGLSTDMHLGLTPRFFPKFIIIFMAILAGLMWMSAYREPVVKSTPSEPDDRKTIATVNAVLILAAGLLYICFLKFLGYLIATPLILAFYLFYFGVRSWIKMIGVSVITTGVLYYFFGKVMHVLMPVGSLF